MFGWLKELLDLRIEYKSKKIQLDYNQFNLKSSENESLVSKERDLNVCESCETLKMQLAIANQEKKDLLNRILTPVTTGRQEVIIENPKAVIPQRHLGFNARRKALEAESRNHAMLLAQQRKTDEAFKQQADVPQLKVVAQSDNENDTSVEDLEAELNIAGDNREAQSGVK